jgi:predicted small lipoprotein YifL
MIHSKLFITAAVALLALTACGGGGGGFSPPIDNTVPASALESSEAFSRYVGGLPATEDAEPLALTDVVPPTSETDGEIDPD